MTTKKITKREMFNAVIAYINAHDDFGTENISKDVAVDMLNHEIDLLTRKNASGEKKLTAAQQENETLKAAIVANMEDDRLYTVAEMLKTFPECNGKSTSKVSAMLRQLIEDGRVNKVVEKRKSFFQKI